MLERRNYYDFQSFTGLLDSFSYDNQNRKILERRYAFAYFGDQLESIRYSYNEKVDSIIRFNYLDGDFIEGKLEVRSRIGSDSIVQKYFLEFESVDNTSKTSHDLYSELSFPHGKEYDYIGYTFDENQDSVLRSVHKHNIKDADETFYILETTKDLYHLNGEHNYTGTELKKYINWDFLTFTNDAEAIEIFPNPIGVGQAFSVSSEQLLDASYYFVNSAGQVVYSNSELGATFNRQMITPDIPGIYYIILRDNQGNFIKTKPFIVH